MIPVPTISSRIKKFQSATNIVLFKNKDDKRLSALIPDFKDVVYKGISLNQLVIEAYKKSGIFPIPVKDKFHQVNGNTHCAVSVIR